MPLVQPAVPSSAPPDRAWFDDLLRRYEARIFNVIYALLDDYEEAADLTQETFIRAYRGWASFRGESHVYTWLYRIAVNLTKNRLKQLRRQNQVEELSLDAPVESEEEELSRQVADWTHCPERHVQRQEVSRIVREAIQHLPPDFREIIVLRELQELSYQELTEVLGLSMGAVKSRLFRARAQLKQLLEPHWEVLLES